MQSILSEIFKLRKNIPINPERTNKNRYCIISNDNKYKTAYCFGVPIYHSSNRKLLDLKFQNQNRTWKYDGSNAHIEIKDTIILKNPDGTFELDLSDSIIHGTDRAIHYKNTEIYPTLNGISVKQRCEGITSTKIKVCSQKPFLPYWANAHCFCLMKSDFEPLFSVSCIGASIDSARITSPIKLSYHKRNDDEYTLELSKANPTIRYIIFEVNMYEKKLFQDTTVESANPSMNNVYGTTAFIGTSAQLGEQWLYTRIDSSLISDFFNRKIEKVVMHVPELNSGIALAAYRVSSRFCSFGSNWDNKIPLAASAADLQAYNGYQSMDISDQIIDSATKYLKKTEGFIIKPKVKQNGFTAITTGDSFYAPQILEICYR